MSKFIDRFFGSKTEVDVIRMELQARLSFQLSQSDTSLLLAYAQANRLGELSDFQKEIASCSMYTPWSVAKEVQMLQYYVRHVQAIQTEEFYLQFNAKVSDHPARIEPLMLFPLIQNAVKNGYASMAKFPIKVRISASEGGILLEVSNRVNHYVENQGEDELITYYRERLQLFHPDRHELFVNSNSQTFKATLFLKYE
ncbi:LytS family sensor histidine kinase [Sphingobacterium corticibacter]|uniref:Histidine kinase n=1 Tax=Sphingobacterium corticibacter TaxID=2171749 RepID=A0A2T8HIW6_9SPHI|nr:histidine kinase [Sphingobacterium corticibacter]PVH25396.1 histidine kinase [Sphingobacterium corticibacter]